MYYPAITWGSAAAAVTAVAAASIKMLRFGSINSGADFTRCFSDYFYADVRLFIRVSSSIVVAYSELCTYLMSGRSTALRHENSHARLSNVRTYAAQLGIQLRTVYRQVVKISMFYD